MSAADLTDEQLLDQLEESLNRSDATHTQRALKRLRRRLSKVETDRASAEADADCLRAENEMLRSYLTDEDRAKLVGKEIPEPERLAHAVRDVAAFMRGTGEPILDAPGIPDEATVVLASKLIDEEVNAELRRLLVHRARGAAQLGANSVGDKDLVCEIADGVVDSIYVLVWTANAFGFGRRLSRVWRAVQDANMRKFDGPKDPVTGKQLKPEGWEPPDVWGAVYGD